MGFLNCILRGFIPVFLGLLGVIAITQVIQNSRNLSHSNALLKDMVAQAMTYDEARFEQLSEQLHERVLFYESEIAKTHTLDGMIVNREILDGKTRDVCDSLLFSSLRYVSLKKLGYEKRADLAWQGIKGSYILGKWQRHPTCDHWTSRDMILGLMIALSQSPPDSNKTIEELFNYVDVNDGYFGDGPIYVSFLTPGLAETLRRMSILKEIQERPPIIARGFSTFEFDTLFTQRGYTSHLLALHLWLELEVQSLYSEKGLWRGPRSILWELGNVLSPFTIDNVYQQRRMWLAQQIFEVDHKNLFFKWLRLKLGGVYDRRVQVAMLEELLTMPQFPEDSLPQNCHRSADYLWQRDSQEYSPSKDCTRQFSGVDFLWLAALLLDGDPSDKIM